MLSKPNESNPNPMSKPVVTVTCELGDAQTPARELLTDTADLRFVAHSASQAQREAALTAADALLVGVLPREVPYELWPEMTRCRFVQTAGTGIDYIDRTRLPEHLTFAFNPGVSGPPIAEHALGMAISLLRRLPQNHQGMREGRWDQWVPTRTLNGARCAILGYGGIGREIARLVRAFGARVVALNSSGTTSDPVEACYDLARLADCVAGADVIFCCLPLNDITLGAVGATAFQAMQHNGVFISLSRGEVIDETALYEKLRDHRDFSAGIDAWWVEPVRHGRFETKHPFLDMPNVIASPHNSAVVPGSMDNACRTAVINLKNHLTGGPVVGIARPTDWLSQ